MIKQGKPSQLFCKFEKKEIPLWIRFCLWFIKPKIAYDVVDPRHYIIWKRFMGTMYVVGESE